ncbi:MAG: MlaC/ttg2D family ABC transporter substrate-binding protein [Candidatus Methylomirabilia bacterium]
MIRFMLAVFVTLLAVRPAGAQEIRPIDALRGPLDTALAILQDPRYRVDAEKEAQKEKLWEIIREVFDFDGITERAVGRNWKLFTPAQKKEFADVFTTLLGNSYLTKIQGNFNNEKVEFLSQEMLAANKARVKTKIVREVDSIPVDYSVRPLEGTWKIYDVNIEGVSLVQNYRSQFDQILSKDSPAVLIERVRDKNKAQEKEKK